MMKNKFKYFLLVFPALLCIRVSAQKNGFSIQGSSQPLNYPLLWVAMEYENSLGQKQRDTCIVRDGGFRFSGTLSETQRVVFWFMPDTSSPLIKVKRVGSQPIVIDAAAMELDYFRSGKFQLRGSDSHEAERRFQASYLALLKQGGSSGKEGVRKELIQRYIRENPGSAFSLILLEDYISNALQADSITALFKQVPFSKRSSPRGLRIQAQLAWLTKVQSGDKAPLFSLPDSSGKESKLSSLQGKYVLLHFWASWCQSCRKENKHLLKAYEQVKGLPVVFAGISLDETGAQWKNAIVADQLNWLQLHALNGFDSQVAKGYGVKSIPRTFLLDPSGRIIAMDLRGEELGENIKSFLK